MFSNIFEGSSILFSNLSDEESEGDHILCKMQKTLSVATKNRHFSNFDECLYEHLKSAHARNSHQYSTAS